MGNADWVSVDDLSEAQHWARILLRHPRYQQPPVKHQPRKLKNTDFVCSLDEAAAACGFNSRQAANACEKRALQKLAANPLLRELWQES